ALSNLLAQPLDKQRVRRETLAQLELQIRNQLPRWALPGGAGGDEQHAAAVFHRRLDFVAHVADGLLALVRPVFAPGADPNITKRAAARPPQLPPQRLA